jgi:nucleoside-diphosphate-sugar epimerase
MDNNVLVVGGAGYLGSRVVEYLPGCTVYDDLLHSDEYLYPVRFVRGDVCDCERLQPLLDEADCVIWLAALVGDAICAYDPGRAIAVNQHAVEYLAGHYSGPVIFMSTCSVYGHSDGIATEDAPVRPLSVYAETKLGAETALLKQGQALILRLGTLHGTSPRMRFDLVVNAMTLVAVSTGRVHVFGGQQRRPLLGVRDAGQFIASQVSRDWTPGIYNLATQNLPVLDIAGAVLEELPGTELEVLGGEIEDRRDYAVNCDRAAGLWGFHYACPVSHSVRDIAAVLRAGRIKNPHSPRYVNKRGG